MKDLLLLLLMLLLGVISAASDPSSPTSAFWTNLGYVALLHNEGILAGQRFSQAVESDQTRASAWRGRGSALATQGRMIKGLECYDRALRLRSDYRLARLERAELRSKLGDRSGARDDWLSIGSIDLLLTLGHAARANRNAESAIGFYRMAAEVAPQDWRAHYYLAVVLHAEGHTSEAYECVQIGLALSTSNASLLFLRGKIEYELQLYTKALEQFSSYIEMSPQEVRGWTWRGLCWESLRSFRKAVDDYEEAVTLDPRNSNSHFRLANVLEKLGEPCQALEEYTAALVLGHPRAREGIERLGAVPCLGR